MRPCSNRTGTGRLFLKQESVRELRSPDNHSPRPSRCRHRCGGRHRSGSDHCLAEEMIQARTVRQARLRLRPRLTRDSETAPHLHALAAASVLKVQHQRRQHIEVDVDLHRAHSSRSAARAVGVPRVGVALREPKLVYDAYRRSVHATTGRRQIRQARACFKAPADQPCGINKRDPAGCPGGPSRKKQGGALPEPNHPSSAPPLRMRQTLVRPRPSCSAISEGPTPSAARRFTSAALASAVGCRPRNLRLSLGLC